MSNLYNLTQQLHQTIQEKAEKHGLKIEIKNKFEWVITPYDYEGNEYDLLEHGSLGSGYLVSIQATQIRQILLAFKEVLGESEEILENKKELERLLGKDNTLDYLKNIMDEAEYLNQFVDNNQDRAITQLESNIKNTPNQFYVDELCSRWLDGLEPLFDREPENILTELLEILKSI